jgi:hypothetical protein
MRAGEAHLAEPAGLGEPSLTAAELRAVGAGSAKRELVARFGGTSTPSIARAGHVARCGERLRVGEVAAFRARS